MSSTSHYFNILSLTERIFLCHIARSNKDLANDLFFVINNSYVLSREYTACGMFVYLDTLDIDVNNGIKLPDCIFGEYICIGGELDSDFILYTNGINKLKKMELVCVQFQFNEERIAGEILDGIISNY